MTFRGELLSVVIALGFGALAGWAAPDVNAWLRAGAPVPVHTTDLEACRAALAAQSERAQRYAGVVAGALNGERITDGTRTLSCREAK